MNGQCQLSTEGELMCLENYYKTLEATVHYLYMWCSEWVNWANNRGKLSNKIIKAMDEQLPMTLCKFIEEWNDGAALEWRTGFSIDTEVPTPNPEPLDDSGASFSTMFGVIIGVLQATSEVCAQQQNQNSKMVNYRITPLKWSPRLPRYYMLAYIFRCILNLRVNFVFSIIR